MNYRYLIIFESMLLMAGYSNAAEESVQKLKVKCKLVAGTLLEPVEIYFALQVPFTDNTTIKQVKQLIATKQKLSENNVSLSKDEDYFLGKIDYSLKNTQLKDHFPCAHYKLHDGSHIRCLIHKE